MSDYLQRLFDRAAALPAPVSPAGPSLSPIALADQRLNDPAMLAAIGPRAGGFDAEAELEVVDFAEPAPRSTQVAPPAAPIARAPPSQAAVTPPEPADTRSRPRMEGAAEASTPAPAPATQTPNVGTMSPVLPVGAVLPEDFVPPEPPAQAEVPRTPAPLPVAPQIPRTEAKAPPPAAPAAAPAQEHRVAPKAASKPVESARPSPVAAREPAEALPPPAPPSTAAADAPAPVVMMPPQSAPPLPEPEPQALPPRPEPEREVRTEKVRERIELVPERSAPRPVRPMTAAEASLIGPLVPRPRVRTFLGMRRR